MSIFHDQADLMAAFGQTKLKDLAQVAMYAGLVEEEYKEFYEAATSFPADIFGAEVVKEAIDVIVVASGFLVSVLGPDGALKAWNAVLESNAAKVVGGVEKRDDGKVLQNAKYKKIAKAKLMSELEELLR